LLLTVPEACAALRISRWSFYQLVRRGQLRTVRIGNRRLMPASALREFIAALGDGDEP
jgi:excisionase family DNA binding protein